jgi:lipopolysaccharide transport system permease protein
MDESVDVTLTDPGVWVIQPRQEGLVARLRDVWRYRKLLSFFAVRSIQKLYRRTVLGWSWILIRPLFPLLVNTVIFGGVLGIGSHGVPYFLFLVTGNALWELFASSVMWGTRSLEINRGFMSKIYVPRLIMPVATMAPAYVNFAITLGVLAVALVYYRMTTGMFYLTAANLGWALLAVVMSAALALGISLWTSVPALQARDVRFTLGYVLGFWVFLTPVLFPLDLPPRWAWALMLNPMAAIVNAFKYGVLGLPVLNVRDLSVAAVIIAVVGLSGLWFFGRAEATAADRV